MKAGKASEANEFKDIPNIGPAMVQDFISLGLKDPQDLKKKDPFRLYKKMCQISGTRQDPCVLDTYIAAVAFMNGAPPRPWWYYTKDRKKKYPNL